MVQTKIAFTNFSGKLTLLGSLLMDTPEFDLQEEFVHYDHLLDHAKRIRFTYHNTSFILVYDGLITEGVSFIDILKSMRTIKQHWRACHIVLVSDFANGTDIFSAIRFGASGLLESSARSVEMIEALKTISKGGAPITTGISRKIFQHFELNTLSTLTNREIEVLELLSTGFTFNKISQQMGVNMETTKTHVRHIYDKLDVAGKMEAIAVAKANKFIL